MKKEEIICTFCGTTIKSLKQANEVCEERDYSQQPHALRDETRDQLIERELRKPRGRRDYVEAVKASRFPVIGDIRFAVFNVREEEHAEARKEFEAAFGADRFKRVIQPILDAGIMSIFEKKPTQETACFALAVARRVEDRVARQKAAAAKESA